MLRHAYGSDRQKRKRLTKEKAMEDSERTCLHLLRQALGDYADTPLGQAAMAGSA
ncbi:MAG: hypothetical protein HC889_17370 [Synechococcaceae cyanobacterium SM1_2_3]|nr:hypothetical protein [Synechococcaceae cyanobacterium SM1_2_3]